MLAVMSEPSELVSLQIKVPKRLRARLKARAASEEIDMADLGDIILTHVLDLFEAEKVPEPIQKAIQKVRDEKKS